MSWRINALQWVSSFKESQETFIPSMLGLASLQRFNRKIIRSGKSFILRADKQLRFIKDCLKTKATVEWQM